MAGINRTTGKATDLITFSRASGGTALRKISYGSELAPSLSTAIKVGDAATTIAYNSGAGSLDIDAATTLDGAILLVSGVVVGRVYLFTADITLGTCTDSRITVGPSFTNQARLQSSGTVSLVFTAEDTQIRIDSYADTGTFTINSISVKEVFFDQPDGTLTLFNHPTNIPRIEYDAAGNVKGLLIEEARTNLVPYSSDFTNAAWGKTRSSISSGEELAPDGNTATKLVEDTTLAASHTLVYQYSSAPVSTYTNSIFVKAAGRTNVRLAQTISESFYADFSLSDGSYTAGPSTTASSQYIGNGWYRLSITYTTTSIHNVALVVYISTGTSTTYDGDGTSGIYIYGAQLEAGSFPTSYIPTSGATATRAADIASISVDNFGYNQKAGTLVVDYAAYIPQGRFAAAYGANGTNYIGVGYSNYSVYVQPLVGVMATTSTFDGEFHKQGVTFDARGASATKVSDNSVVEVSATGNLPALTDSDTLYIGTSPFAPNFIFSGHIKSITYHPRRLSNAQLQALTA